MANKLKDEWVDVPLGSTNSKDEWIDVPLDTQPQTVAKPEFKTSVLESGARGFADTATFGFNDEIQGAIGGATRGLKQLFGQTQGDKGFLDAVQTGYKSERDANRVANTNAMQDNTAAYIGGGLTAAVPGVFAKGAITIPSMIAQGAVGGFGSAEGDLAQQAKGTAIGAGIGGTLGAAAQYGAPLITKGLNNLKTNLGLIGLGSKTPAIRAMGESAPDVVQSALTSGAMNPFRTVAGQTAANERVLQSSGKQLENVREQLPNVPLDDIMAAIEKRSAGLGSKSYNESANSQISRLKGDIMDVVPQNANVQEVGLKDIVDLKGGIGKASRTAYGDVTKNKEGMEIVRQALRDVEVDTASKLAPEYKSFLQKSSSAHTVAELLKEKDITNKASSLISLGGMIGTAGGAGYTASTGDPKGLLLGAMFSKTGRDLLARSGAVSINAVQKLATKLKIDPKVVAYLLSRETSNSQKGEK